MRFIVDTGIGLSYRVHTVGWQAGTTTPCRSQLYPPSQGYKFGTALFVSDLQDVNKKLFFCLLHHSSQIKSHEKVEIKGFLKTFCLMMKGSVSGTL
jgi:hypothetical protein